MGKDSPKRRMIENQVVFRGFNEQIQKGFDNLNKIAEEEGQEPYVLEGDMPLYFCCECSDEKCKKRILIGPNAYNKIHKDRDTFIIARGHEVEQIERIIAEEPEYCIVKKYQKPPASADTLHTTPVDNTNVYNHS